MVCRSVLLPLTAGMLFCAVQTSARNHAPDMYAEHTLSFVENKGQIVNQLQQPRRDIDFRLRTGNGPTIFAGSGCLHYQWIQRPANAASAREPVQIYRMDVCLVHANKNAAVLAEAPQHYYERYYTPAARQHNSGKDICAGSYARVVYKNIYPHIDWVLYIKDNTLKYDFVVHPGGRVSDIQISYRGATRQWLHKNGSLTSETPAGSITEDAPRSYTRDGQHIASAYTLAGNLLSFKTAAYDGTLVIDPSFEWGTYFGGTDNDQPTAMTADEDGNIYVSGGTLSLDNIATTGSFQTSYGGASGAFIMGDAFLAKFSPDGACRWATYYGGPAEDRGLDVSWDSLNRSIYLAGSTKSATGMSTTGAHQEQQGGNFDAFLARFDTSGQRIWSTYYGGSGKEGSSYTSVGTACDGRGNVLLTGETGSTNQIATAGSYQSGKESGTDAFVAKFDSLGVRLWATYLGGDGNDVANKISCDSSAIYVVGNTTSTQDFATAGSYQAANGGGTDGFIARLDSSGNVAWIRYFGGPGYDDIQKITADHAGNLYIGGSTSSTTAIATAGSYQDTLGGTADDGFLAKLTAEGSVRWSTYYGGEDYDGIASLALEGNTLYACGYTASTTGIATPGSYLDSLSNTGYDAFIAELDTSGQRVWASYYGGTETEQGICLASGGSRRLYCAGLTNSPDGIASPGAYQSSFGGGMFDAFLVKFNMCDVPQPPGNIMGDTVLCSGQEYLFLTDTVPDAASYIWTFPAAWTGIEDTTHIRITPDNSSGIISVAAINSCGMSDSVSLQLTVHPSPEPVILQDGALLTTTQPYAGYTWVKDGVPVSGATAATYTVTADGNYAVTVTNEYGCTGTSDTVSMTGLGINGRTQQTAQTAVYPNPATDIVHIFPEAPYVQVLSPEGRVLSAAAHVRAVRLGGLADGLYLLRIYDKDGRMTATKKIIKNNNGRK